MKPQEQHNQQEPESALMTLGSTYAEMSEQLGAHQTPVVQQAILTLVQRGIFQSGDTISVRLVNQGGMGKVYEIARTRMEYQDEAQQHAALPILLKHETRDALKELLQPRFEPEKWQSKEAQIQRKIGNAPKVHEESDRFIVMEYLHGVDGASLLPELVHASEETKAYVSIELTKLLRDVRRARHVHRDFKPANVHIDKDGNMKILDFGLALKSQGRETALIDGLAVSGTTRYMPPEQMRGQMHNNTDVFALGCTLFELHTGLNFLKVAMLGVDPSPSNFQKMLNLNDHHFHAALQKYVHDPFLNNLLQKMLVSDPEQRPRVSQVLRILEKQYKETLSADFTKDAKHDLARMVQEEMTIAHAAQILEQKTQQVIEIPASPKRSAA